MNERREVNRGAEPYRKRTQDPAPVVQPTGLTAANRRGNSVVVGLDFRPEPPYMEGDSVAL